MENFYLEASTGRMVAQPVLYMRRTGAYGPENYALMRRFKDWLRANGLFTEDAVVLGIPLDDPAVTPAQDCRYDVCLTQPRTGWEGLRGAEFRWMDGGDYVTFLLPHTAEAMQRAWSECLAEAERCGYPPDPARPVLERYEKRKVDAGLCELCVPVIPPAASAQD